MNTPISDGDLLTLCVIQEAADQIPDGQAAVARVVLNRTQLKYASDGSIAGTTFAHDQFSWTEFAMQGGVYRRVATDGAQELSRVAAIMAKATAETGTWVACQAIAWHVQEATYRGTLYDQLTDQVVLYDNLALTRPAWVAESHFVAMIGAYSFYQA